jgi:hypothetical protein
MINFSNFINQPKKDPKSKTFHAFDMDDTLFTHNSRHLKIHVKDASGNKIKSLTTKQFNNHKLEKGHSYDFSQFKSTKVFEKSAKPIGYMLRKLKQIHRRNKNVEILTAREDMDDKEHFRSVLNKHGIDINKIHVRRAGNISSEPPHENKKRAISALIKKHGYTKVHLYDDSEANLSHFLSLKKHFPNVKFKAHHVTHDKNGVNIKSKAK